jgi:hypothetical protein
MLAPDTVEAILAGRMNQALMLERLERLPASSWEQQRQMIGHSEAKVPARSRSIRAAIGCWCGKRDIRLSMTENLNEQNCT